MNRQRALTSMMAIITLAGATGAAYWIGRHQTGTSPVTGAPDSPVAVDRKILYWHDPMVPGPRFDKPGKSPFMDMQLVPKYADDASNDASITVSPHQQQNLGIRTAVVEYAVLPFSTQLNGSIAWNERDTVLVQARGTGYVERLAVRTHQESVHKGQVLAELYIPEFVAAQEDYLAVRRMSPTVSLALVDAARQRMRVAGMTEDQIQQVELNGEVQPHTKIIAPRTGILAELTAREGMAVAIGTPLFRVQGADTVWLQADVPEQLASRLQPGMPVEVRTAVQPTERIKGKLEALLPNVDLTTRTLRARIVLANPGQRLAPGMFATVSVEATAGPSVLVVPSEAVIRTGARSIVFIAGDGGQFSPVEIETGTEHQGMFQVIRGLSAGQRVVTSGQFLIDSEASLRGTLARTEQVRSTAVPSPVHHGVGKVKKIGQQEITLSHGPIASLEWGPMTMPFKLPETPLPSNVRVGGRVRFDFRKVEDGYQIIHIEPGPAAVDGEPHTRGAGE